MVEMGGSSCLLASLQSDDLHPGLFHAAAACFPSGFFDLSCSCPLCSELLLPLPSLKPFPCPRSTSSLCASLQTWADTFISELNDTHVEAELRTRNIPPAVRPAASCRRLRVGRRHSVLHLCTQQSGIRSHPPCGSMARLSIAGWRYSQHWNVPSSPPVHNPPQPCHLQPGVQLDTEALVAAYRASRRRLLVLGYNATLTTAVEAPRQPKKHFDQIQVQGSCIRSCQGQYRGSAGLLYLGAVRRCRPPEGPSSTEEVQATYVRGGAGRQVVQGSARWCRGSWATKCETLPSAAALLDCLLKAAFIYPCCSICFSVWSEIVFLTRCCRLVRLRLHVQALTRVNPAAYSCLAALSQNPLVDIVVGFWHCLSFAVLCARVCACACARARARARACACARASACACARACACANRPQPLQMILRLLPPSSDVSYPSYQHHHHHHFAAHPSSCSPPLQVISGGEKHRLEEVFSGLHIWLAAENGAVVRPAGSKVGGGTVHRYACWSVFPDRRCPADHASAWTSPGRSHRPHPARITPMSAPPLAAALPHLSSPPGPFSPSSPPPFFLPPLSSPCLSAGVGDHDGCRHRGVEGKRAAGV